KYGYRPEEVASALGSVQLFRVVVRLGWLKPVIQRKKLTLFDSGDVARVWGRIIAGDDPWGCASCIVERLPRG
ncbi:MAG: hypothetical protein ACOYM3_27765, partial [Terrimicrobiaceae bacterium]